ncbi:Neuronal membrane glycoprotein M6-a [Chionoecetes opilio]|uniref:Neuronal membrane glycoprotein M6-a n=1 Tax=Chionoecetes opilio TaxID=41210 RepID=A0A8J4Y736_CHIOP|nr:Neuronal membrane glycoprotein M6-a [Chionoecetes opilio]
MEGVQLAYIVVGAGMGGLGLLLLVVGCLSSGNTLHRVYHTWRARLGGKITCAIEGTGEADGSVLPEGWTPAPASRVGRSQVATLRLMVVAYVVTLAWLVMFAALVIVSIFYTLAWFQCINVPNTECIDYNQFRFLFPRTTIEEEKRVCSGGKRKLFCKDFVNNAEILFLLATASTLLVILSMVHYLMCLAANYTHIKDHGKLMELRDIDFLHQDHLSTMPKDRF